MFWIESYSSQPMSLLNHLQQCWKNLGSQVFCILSHSETFRPDVTTVTNVESSLTSAVVLLEMSGNTVKSGIRSSLSHYW